MNAQIGPLFVVRHAGPSPQGLAVQKLLHCSQLPFPALGTPFGVVVAVAACWRASKNSCPRTRSSCRCTFRRARKRGSSEKSSLEPQILEKELRRLGVASRREEANLIKTSRVSIDGVVVRDNKAVVPVGSVLAVDGVELDRQPPVLLKFYKPLDVICSMRDHQGRTDLKDAIPGQIPRWAPRDQEVGDEPGALELPWVAVDRYHPVGRLDRDTSGLLLFSSDGQLTRRLLSPSWEVPRRYSAVVDGDVEQGDGGSALAQQLEGGVRTSEGIFPATAIELTRLAREEAGGSSTEKSRVVLEVKEGKYRMVRDMLYKCGFPVLELHRTHYGALELGDLRVGAFARPSEQEANWAAGVLDGSRKGNMADTVEPS